MDKNKKDVEFYIDEVKKILNKSDSPLLANVHSYGCQLNFSDGEKLKGLLLKMGYGFTDNPEKASLVLFNTCAVRETAEDKVFGNIGEIKNIKHENPDMIVGMCGCMASLPHVVERLRKSYPFVDMAFGTSEIKTMPKLIYDVLTERKHEFISNRNEKPEIYEYENIVRDSKFKASVPVMFGCNNFCSYCIVPYVRGRERSRKPEDIMNEVKSLVADGYKEIMLLGQNVNSYGKDLSDSDVDFSELLKMINDISGEFVIRFMSSHPKDATKKLIDTILECNKVAKHLHLPIQSGSDEVLKEMNRNYTVEKYLEIVDYARSKCPYFSFTTDIIVGFPNETHEQFLKTLDVMRYVKYDNIYSFIYSKRSGTKAALIDDSITDGEKSRNMMELLKLQREIATDNYKRFIGRTFTVLVDGDGRYGDGWLAGRSDEFIITQFKGEKMLIGQFVKVKITEVHNWSVTGELLK